jgi:hypothetical protein
VNVRFFGSIIALVQLLEMEKAKKVLGQIMMLKDANSKQVINDVKSRIT